MAPNERDGRTDMQKTISLRLRPGIIRIDWRVKGYHNFTLRPHPAVTMLVEPENGNRFDLFAMKVMMPTLVNIPPHLHQEVTRPVSQRHSQPQTVADIAGNSSVLSSDSRFTTESSLEQIFMWR